MKNVFLVVFILLNTMMLYAQNPYKYDTKTVTIDLHYDWESFFMSKYNINSNEHLRFSIKSVTFDSKNQRTSSIYNYQNRRITVNEFIEAITKQFNNKGYHFVSTSTLYSSNDRTIQTLYFESGAYKKDELTALENRLNNRVDEKTKAYIDKAKVEINTAVLAYLSKVPDEIFTSEFKKQLQTAIMLEVEKKLKAMSDEIKQEIKNELQQN